MKRNSALPNGISMKKDGKLVPTFAEKSAKPEALALAASGMPVSKISNHLALPAHTIRQWLSQAGITEPTSHFRCGKLSAQEAEAARAAGTPIEILAEIAGVKPNSMRTALSNYRRLVKKRAVRQIKKIDKERAVALYLAGETTDELAAKFGVSSAGIRKVLNSAGFNPAKLRYSKPWTES